MMGAVEICLATCRPAATVVLRQVGMAERIAKMIVRRLLKSICQALARSVSLKLICRAPAEAGRGYTVCV